MTKEKGRLNYATILVKVDSKLKIIAINRVIAKEKFMNSSHYHWISRLCEKPKVNCEKERENSG